MQVTRWCLFISFFYFSEHLTKIYIYLFNWIFEWTTSKAVIASKLLLLRGNSCKYFSMLAITQPSPSISSSSILLSGHFPSFQISPPFSPIKINKPIISIMHSFTHYFMYNTLSWLFTNSNKSLPLSIQTISYLKDSFTTLQAWSFWLSVFIWLFQLLRK